MVQEVCTICSQAAAYHPALVLKLLVRPLVARIRQELPEKGERGAFVVFLWGVILVLFLSFSFFGCVGWSCWHKVIGERLLWYGV